MLIQAILQAAHNEAGHNRFPRTYSAIRRLYYWKGIKEDVLQHCRNCYTCQLHKTAAVKFEAKHFKPLLKPMDFIAMDLIGEFHPPSSQGNRYALTGVCMLTGFTWCIPIKSKKATDVAQWCKMCAYMRTICSKTCAKICKKITYLVFMANVANFALFARALCERCRICIIHCTFLEFSGLTPSLLVMVRI